jgi:hypothetical protein
MAVCNQCNNAIFWLKDDGRNVPFDEEVTVLEKPGQKYADGYDKVKLATEKDVANKVKGFLCHFITCKS